MEGIKKVHCRVLFKKLNILPLDNEFILSLLSFAVDNMEEFQRNLDIHRTRTRHTHDLHGPSANLTIYQKRVYYICIKVFNNHPSTIKNLNQYMKTY